MGESLSVKNIRFVQKDQDGVPIGTFVMGGLDMKAKVVCKRCNESWMSDLESIHAKPALERLIIGSDATQITISQSRAKSIALFAFKTAVIVDHMSRGRPPFFCRSVRYRFATTNAIPDNVRMWMAGYLPIRTGTFTGNYGDAVVPHRGRLKLYICTYAAGHFIFQLVAARYYRTTMTAFAPEDNFEYLAMPFWPTMPIKIRWPPPDVLRTSGDLARFANRWSVVKFV